jgi:hypothetical protein
MEKIFTVKIEFKKNDTSEEVFAEFQKDVEKNMLCALPASKGRAEARLLSIEVK